MRGNRACTEILVDVPGDSVEVDDANVVVALVGVGFMNHTPFGLINPNFLMARRDGAAARQRGQSDNDCLGTYGHVSLPKSAAADENEGGQKTHPLHALHLGDQVD